MKYMQGIYKTNWMATVGANINEVETKTVKEGEFMFCAYRCL